MAGELVIRRQLPGPYGLASACGEYTLNRSHPCANDLAVMWAFGVKDQTPVVGDLDYSLATESGTAFRGDSWYMDGTTSAGINLSTSYTTGTAYSFFADFIADPGGDILLSNGSSQYGFLQSGGSFFHRDSVFFRGVVHTSPINMRHCYLVTHDGVNPIRFFRNGVYLGVGVGSASTGTFTISNFDGYALPFEGELFSVGVFDRALSDEEAIYVSESPYRLLSRNAPLVLPGEAAAPSGFQPAWAVNATTTISGGIAA